MDAVQVILALLELVRACGQELCGGERAVEVRNEKCGKCEVERKYGLDPMSHIEGGIAG